MLAEPAKASAAGCVRTARLAEPDALAELFHW